MATTAEEIIEKKNHPESFVTLTIRLIRSFEHRNIRFLVLKNIDLNWTTEKLIEKTLEEVEKCSTLPKPFRTFKYDTMKVRCFDTFVTLLSKNV
jgi:hypothetical protein